MTEGLDIERLVGEMEIAVDRLRSLYEQYFMGIEKLEPTVARKDLDRRIQVLRKEQIRNTAQRFRFQMVLQRYNTYQTHWMRVCREIENGTYKRHVVRAQQRFAPEAPQRASVRPPPVALPRSLAEELAELDREFAPPESLADLDLELVEDPKPPPRRPSIPPPAGASPQIWRRAPPAPPRAPDTSSPPLAGASPAPQAPTKAPNPAGARPPPAPPAKAVAAPAPGPVRPPPAPAVKAPPPPPVAQPSPPARSAGELPDERVRQLYTQFVDAKRRQNESTAAITYDAVAKSLRDSSAKLREKHGKAVDFEVSVKDGKAVLKPVLK